MSGTGATVADPTGFKSTAPAGRAGRRPTRSGWLTGGYVLAGILALVPIVRMIGIVLDGSALQYNDYWLMLPRILSSGGGFDLGGLLHFQNEHPVVIPQILYWLNVRAFSGSNITLGLLVVAIVAGQLAIIALLIRDSALRPVDRMVILVLASALLFDLTGTWNFSVAMSGTAWLTANLFALGAIYLRSRDRRWISILVAVGAAVSYGTGIMVWPALIATGMCRRPKQEFWREWPNAVGFVITYVWYRTSSHGSAGDFSDVTGILQGAARTLGFVLGLGGRPGEIVGYVALVGVPVLAVWFFTSRRPRGSAGWIGIATFGWFAVMEISSGRRVFITLGGPANRYTSLPALVWIGFAALAVLAIREVVRRRAESPGSTSPAARTRPGLGWIALPICVPLLFGAFVAGRAHADDMLALRSAQKLPEIALRFGITHDTYFLLGVFGSHRDIGQLLRSTGHFPFVDSWDLDCGLRGQRLRGTEAGARIDGAVVSAQAGRAGQPPQPLSEGLEITGHVADDRAIHCMVVTNDQGVVVGAGAVGNDLHVAHPPSETGFRAIARSGGSDYKVYVILDGSDTPHLLGDVAQRALPLQPTGSG